MKRTFVRLSTAVMCAAALPVVVFAVSSTPSVTTTSYSNVTQTTADADGDVTSDGGNSIIECGICYNTSGVPTTSDDTEPASSGTGPFTVTLSGLAPGTTYHIRAYARNGNGTSYGGELSFTTVAAPSNSGASDSADCTPGTGSAALWSMMVLAMLTMTRRFRMAGGRA